jgi:hypothetical protein
MTSPKNKSVIHDNVIYTCYLANLGKSCAKNLDGVESEMVPHLCPRADFNGKIKKMLV